MLGHVRLLIQASILALLVPCAASAQAIQTPGSNVLLVECNPHQHSAGQAHPWIDPYGYWHRNLGQFPYREAFLAITFENKGPLIAAEIDFGLVARGSLIAVAKDVGKFPPGVTIDHEFVVSPEVLPLDSVPYCAVLRVKYADGSVWRNPLPLEP